jgi:arylsulfatase A-like enzyme
MADPAAGGSRRRFLLGAGALVGLGAAAAVGATSIEDDPVPPSRRRFRRASRPNVLYVTADDLGTRLGAYGHEAVSTPRIDRFAQSGLLFERAYAQIALCGPSRTSILTGLRPETTGVLGNDDQWQAAAPGAVTLARHFRDAGYATLGTGKIEDPRNGPLDDAWDERRVGRRDEQPADAIALLDHAAAAGGPWFAAIGFHEPHCPWTPSDASLARYGDVDVLEEAGPERATTAGFLAQCTPETRPEEVEAGSPARLDLTEAEAADITRRYLASVTDIDTMFGQVLDHADKRRLLDDTVVIFWSGDHGFQLGDHGWGKWTCYDAATRIPLILRLPGMEAAARRAVGVVEAVDMYPTLVELCDLGSPPQELDGVSFAPLLDQPERPWKRAAFNRFGRHRSVKTERHDLIVDDVAGTEALFDLVEDPGELVDLAPARPDLVAELRELLDAGPAAALPDA